MTVIAVTRLHLRRFRHAPAFFWYVARSTSQARRSPGFLGGRLANEGPRGYWTVTLWRDEAAMREYMRAGAHRRAMPHLRTWCDEAAVVHWEQDGTKLPSLAEVHRSMTVDGRASRLDHPSPGHRAGRTGGREPRLGLALKPARIPTPAEAVSR